MNRAAGSPGRHSVFDRDDASIRRFGREASAADHQAVAALLRRYYTAAIADDGAAACALTSPRRARSLAEDYGPTYAHGALRGAKGCPEVLAFIFKTLHARLTAPMRVIGVRVEGDRAEALLASSTMPASVTAARREHGVWKLDRVLAGQLP